MNTFTKSVIIGAVSLGAISITVGARAGGKYYGHGGHHVKFEQVDANADGFITKEEMTAHFVVAQDTDGDGALSQDEMKAAMEKRMAERKAESDHKHDPARMEKRFGRMFRALDENSDGKITMTEMPDRNARMFEKVDTDKDGKISKAESDAAREKRKEHRKKKNKG